MKLITDKGHCWITFDNGYTLSIFNGYGSYSDNHFNNRYIIYPSNDREIDKYVTQKVESSNCEIAIINSDGDLITNDILQCDDSVKGYVDINELVEIINKVNNLKGNDSNES